MTLVGDDNVYSVPSWLGPHRPISVGTPGIPPSSLPERQIPLVSTVQSSVWRYVQVLDLCCILRPPCSSGVPRSKIPRSVHTRPPPPARVCWDATSGAVEGGSSQGCKAILSPPFLVVVVATHNSLPAPHPPLPPNSRACTFLVTPTVWGRGGLPEWFMAASHSPPRADAPQGAPPVHEARAGGAFRGSIMLDVDSCCHPLGGWWGWIHRPTAPLPTRGEPRGGAGRGRCRAGAGSDTTDLSAPLTRRQAQRVAPLRCQARACSRCWCDAPYPLARPWHVQARGLCRRSPSAVVSPDCPLHPSWMDHSRDHPRWRWHTTQIAACVSTPPPRLPDCSRKEVRWGRDVGGHLRGGTRATPANTATR